MKHVVIAGGGFAGVRLARKLRKNKQIAITLVNESEDFRYSPALYRAATGFKVGTARIPLEWMLIDAGNVNVVYDKAKTIDPAKKTLQLASGELLQYDYAVCALGMTTSYFNIDGVADHAFGVKSIKEILSLKQHIHDTLAGKTEKKQNYVVIGAGPTGVEVAATLGIYVQNVMKKHHIKKAKAEVFLIEAGPRILPQMGEKASIKGQKELEKRGVTVLTNTKVTAETDLNLYTSNGNIATKNVIWTAGATNNPFYSENSRHFSFDEHGKIRVNNRLQTHTNVYVAGDNANTQFSGLAYTAVHHGNYLARDIQARMHGKKRKTYADPYPLQIVPVGKISIFQYRKFILTGRPVNIMRRFADFVGYSDVLGPLKALTIWQNSERLEDEWCKTCRR